MERNVETSAGEGGNVTSPVYVSLPEFGRTMGVTRTTVYRWRDAGVFEVGEEGVELATARAAVERWQSRGEARRPRGPAQPVGPEEVEARRARAELAAARAEEQRRRLDAEQRLEERLTSSADEEGAQSVAVELVEGGLSVEAAAAVAGVVDVDRWRTECAVEIQRAQARLEARLVAQVLASGSARDARWLLARLRPERYAEPVGDHEAAMRRAALVEAQARARIAELEVDDRTPVGDAAAW